MKTVRITVVLLCILSNYSFGQVIERYILALYNSEIGQTPKKNHIHENAEVILNHLGCVVDYWDLKHGMPDEKFMKKYLGVIQLFYGEFTKQPEQYFQWAIQQLASNKRFVILGDAGNSEYDTAMTLKNEFYNRLGFTGEGDWTDDVTKIELVFRDSKMVEFERNLAYEVNLYAKYQSTKPQNKIYLRLKRNDIPNSESDLIITTPNGGFASFPYVIFEDPVTFKKKWRLNPFLFFEEGFGLEDTPKPDVTTLNGSRIWCSHIDGDAMVSATQIKANTICGEIIRDKIIKKYKWPISVSVVVSEVENNQKSIKIARSIFQIPWVEAASHSYSHPFYWAENYDNQDRYANPHLAIAGYTFDIKEEIVGSVKYINDTLLPASKRVKQFFWTGNCEPTPEALKLCKEIKIKNINGGETLFDNDHLSYTSVSPIATVVGRYRQVYAPNVNENIYTNDWLGPFNSYQFVLQTFKNTESPIRIKPINIYYHFYSGEKWASLNALREVLDKTINQDVAPIFISEYLAIVDGFHTAQIEKITSASWKIKNYGHCTTMRFDHTQKYPDFKNSSNVIGFLWRNYKR